MTTVQWIVIAILLARLAELSYGQKNAARLLASGGREVGLGQYPWFAVIHGSWYICLFLLVPEDAPVHAAPLVLYALLQCLRYWAMFSLGGYWTTRVITLPEAPRITSGPYRFLDHPNYVAVVGGMAVLPLAFDAWEIALAYTILNIPLMRRRIRVEEAALAARPRDDTSRASRPARIGIAG